MHPLLLFILKGLGYFLGTICFLLTCYYLLIYIFSKICKPQTQTQKFKKITFSLKFKKFIKFFKFFNKNNAGRNNKGVITVFSKGCRNRQSSISFTKISLWDKSTAVVTAIFRSKKKLFFFKKHLTGSISVCPYIDGISIGQKLFLSNLPKNFWRNNLPGNIVLLKFLSKFTIFSNVCNYGVKRYALSNGTFCQLVDFYYDINIAKITLPSKVTKILSGWNFVILGRNSQVNFCYNRQGKAGVNSIKGRKSKVRGVARNPVDHPHGGRTKTNQPEVSIWGWVAKRNK